jgi:peptidoglycan/LPS O-acetylase OafA/YrhL
VSEAAGSSPVAEPWGIGPPVPPEGRVWFPAIEVLRGIAALAVVADHTWALSGTSESFGFSIVRGLGTWGVDVFFLLSGYLLVDYFWVNRGDKSTLEFYVRRFFRIAPAYYACVVILYLFFAVHSQVFSLQGVKQILANATFTQHYFPGTESNLNVDGSLWTLSIEMTLYLVMPFFAYIIAKKPVLATSALIIVGVGWNYFVQFHGAGMRAYYFGPTPQATWGVQYIYISRQFIGLIPIFAIGMGLRWAVLQGYFDFWVKRPSRHPSVLVLLLLLIPSMLALRYPGISSLWNYNIRFITYDYLLAILAIPALLYAARPSPVHLHAAMRAGVWMGERSYGLYLWHFPVILSVYGMGAETSPPNLHHIVIKVILIFAISIGLGWASFSLIERPFRLKGRDLGRATTEWRRRQRRQPGLASSS